jgi:bifunctional non-homologous end joining protein LigD
MLAVAGQLFDSIDHFFEIKWDGIRAVALVEAGGFRLMSRNGIDLTARYPAVSPLGSLPQGLALDGELVAFRDGKPDFERVLSRAPSASAAIRYVVFDVLYEGYDSRMGLPFSDRRRILERLLKESPCPPLVLSEGVRGEGKELYRRVCEQGLEGVVAKRLSSVYAAGKRNGAWIKIKRRVRLQVAIIGFIEKNGDDFTCLLVAGSGPPGEEGGPLRYVGRVGGGFTDAARAEMNALLREHPRQRPLVKCPERGTWVEPGLYCTVSYAELTAAGMLRAPVFEGLIEA